MSGSSKTWDEPEPPRTPCDRIAFTAIVNSPVAAVLVHVKVGDCLDVVAIDDRGRKIVVVMHNGNILGSLTISAIPHLLTCLADGHLFKAEVLSIVGGRCEVHVTSGSCQ